MVDGTVRGPAASGLTIPCRRVRANDRMREVPVASGWFARFSRRPLAFIALAAVVAAVAALVAVLTADPAGDDTPLLADDVTPAAADSAGATPTEQQTAGGDETTPSGTPDAAAAADGPDADAASMEADAVTDPAAGAPGDGARDDAASPEDVDATGDAPEPASTDAQTDTSTSAPDAEVLVSPNVVRQGETVFVRVPALEAGSVLLTVDDETTRMVREGDDWIGFVPIAPLSDLGGYTVIIDVFDDAGAYQATRLAQFLVVDAGVPIEEITLLPGDEDLLAPELVAIDNNTRFVEHTGVSGPRLWEGPWQRPLQGDDTGIFGALRSYNGAPASDWHHGHDISADTGDPIAAPARGRVVFADELPVHGFGVILDHGAGVYSGYWHMSEIRAQLGELVDAGTVLGLVGDSGLAVGAHLHWEVIVRGQDVDPLQWLEAALHA